MSTNETAIEAKQKRDYFRINQDVIFDFKPVDSYSADNHQAETEFEDAVSLNLLDELRRLDQNSVQTLRALTEKNRLLGDYLQTLSIKIDLIARHALFTRDPHAQAQRTTRINLSEDGLAFICERALYKDSYIAVRMIFLPSYSPVTTFAKVLRCQPKDNEYNVAVKFHRLADAERQELSRQIMKAQTKSRKKST